MKSPCIKVCKLDPALEICVGCFRTIDEIGMWVGFNESKQAHILTLCDIRRAGYRLKQKMEKGNGK